MTFETICEELRRAIHSSGIPRMRSRFHTSDVVQECAMQIWKKIHEQGHSSEEINSSFIRKVAMGHLCRLHRHNLATKRSVRKEDSESAVENVGTISRPDDSMRKHEQAYVMMESLRFLTSQQNEIIIRRFFEEETFDMISTAMNLTIYRVRKLYFASLNKMQGHIESAG